MNTLFILTNTSHHPYHSNILSILSKCTNLKNFNTHIIDINKQSNTSAICQKLSQSSPDLIITLDLAGFELRTVTGECLLNMLPCKTCNIIWGDKPAYKEYLTGKLSLAMLFYDATGKDNQLPAKYSYMRYYYPTSEAIITTQAGSNASESQTVEVLQNIWNHFTKEVLL